MEVHLYLDGTDLQLPVVPATIEVTDPQNNETVNVLNAGEITLIGKRGEKNITLTSMYPGENQHYNFVDIQTGNPYKDFIDILTKWKNDGERITLLVTGTNIKWPATIENLTYSETDHTGDVSYTIELKEYRAAGGRISKKIKTVKYTTKSGDNLKRLAYKYLGASKYASVIYKRNKKAIEKAVKAYIKKYNKKHPKAKLKYKSSEKGRHLVKGIKLVIKQEVV